MDEQVLARLGAQEKALREVAEQLARASIAVRALTHGESGDGWRGPAADAYRAAIETLVQQLAQASDQLAQAVLGTMVLQRGWGPDGR